MATPDPADSLLEKMSPEVRELVQQLRVLIAAVMPQTTEKVHPGWGTFHYGVGGKMRDTLVALAPQRAYVNLMFGDGVDLPDPAHCLEGTGKRARRVKIRGADGVQHPDVRALLVAAARHRGL